MILVGILLLSGLVLIAVEGVGYARGGYGSAFWRLPFDEKLSHISANVWDWWWINIWSMVTLFALTGGVFGLVHLLAVDGDGVLAYVAAGAYVAALIAWVWGLTMQAGAVTLAASRHEETGTAPDWIHPLWRVGYVAEGIWVIGANLAFAVFGLAILAGDLLPSWAGWAALVGGLLIPAGVVVARDGFPQLVLLVPAVIGVGLLVEGI